MMTLYYSPGTASLVVHWLLIETGLPHELRLVDFESREQKSPEYLKLNPGGVVPTMLVDGEPLTEAAALAMHVADIAPQAGLAPAPGSIERARYLQWFLYCANTLQPAFRAWWYPDEPAGADNAGLAKAAAEANIAACFDRIDAHLGQHGPYLLGERVSAADFFLTMLMRWSRKLPRTALDWPHLRVLADTMRARPSFRALYAAEGLEEWA
jgi:glutathione S-transferase